MQIARALMTDPELLLLDEPAAGLDLGAREDLVTRLAGIATDRWAPAQVLVTHHVEEIPAGFTHALLLREGRVVTAGPIHEVLTGRNLSETFGTRLRSGQVRGRYWARAVPADTVARGRRGREVLETPTHPRRKGTDRARATSLDVDAGDAWIVWLIVALVLAGAEAASAGLLLIMFAGGALAASLAAALGAGVVGSAAVFSLVSIGPHRLRPTRSPSGTSTRRRWSAPAPPRSIGTQAVVLEVVDANNGRIKLAGEIWSARTLDEDARFEPGEKVAVFEIDGATAVVG